MRNVAVAYHGHGLPTLAEIATACHRFAVGSATALSVVVAFSVGIAITLIPMTATAVESTSNAISQAAQKHWAFKPPVKAVPPAVKNQGWVQSPIDQFVLARLEAAGLSPAAPADKRTLLRRATFDLTGLPPTPAEFEHFEADRSPNAFAVVVDRLLASPHYGERWARHWLDIARYADTKGYVFLEERRYPWAYAYRDWVIRALNSDIPYDQFLIDQIAADQAEHGDDPAPLAAEGFLTLGRRFLNATPDIIDDRIDVVCRGTMALTVGCARCHDHKFDPIPTADYYSLYSVFNNSREDLNPPVLMNPKPTPEYLSYSKELNRRQDIVRLYVEEHTDPAKPAVMKPGDEDDQARLRGFAKSLPKDQEDRLVELINATDKLIAEDPAAPPRATCLRDLKTRQPQHIFMRGNANNQGAEVPPRFLAILSPPDRKPFTQGSGRLELAEAIASKSNPLTARVMVNRVWLEHFGFGIVRTPSDFGLRSDPPTHPELLDWLAVNFMEHGWSLKDLQRTIMLSSVYQQSSADDGHGSEIDPQNLLLSHQNRRRLDFEATRDAMLAVSGALDEKLYGHPVELTKAPYPNRRTIYGFVDRQNLPNLFRNFDFASPDTTCPRRFTTTVPQQSLFMLNDPFVVLQARRLAARPEVGSDPDPAAAVGALYQTLFCRPPTADETTLAVNFVLHEELEDAPPEGARLTPWEKYAQVLLQTNEFVFLD